MKIGLARRGFSATGGAENYLGRLADGLEAAGHEPVLFAGSGWPGERWPAHRRFVPVDSRSPGEFARRLAQLARPACDRLFSLERVSACDCYRAGDGVHAAWLERQRQTEAPWKSWFRRVSRKHREILALEKNLFAGGGAVRIIANSKMVRDEIVRWYGASPARIDVVYNGLPVSWFQPVEPDERRQARRSLGLADEEYAPLFAGTGWGRKGLSHALAAIGRLPAGMPARLLVAGKGDPSEFSAGTSARTRERTTYLGPRGDMRALYAAADIFLAPTLYDPFSNACLEALASGLPVLTTRANGFAEIIGAGAEGEIIAAEGEATDEELAGAMLKWADPTRRENARTVCAVKAAGFTIEKNVAQTLDVLLRDA